MSVISKLRRSLSSSVFRDVAKLTLGTAGGRIILILMMPIVTRIYSPEDFELLAVFAALVGTLSVVACLRLEIAIPVAEADSDAAHLLAMSLISITSFVVLLLVAALTIPRHLGALAGSPEIGPYMWLVALGVGMMASYSALQLWTTRARRFGVITRTRVSQATVGAMTMVGLGSLGYAPIGLFLGNMFSLGAGGLSLAVNALRQDRRMLSGVSFNGMADTLRRYRRYPILSMPEALANVAGIQAPILLIAGMAESEAGQLFLAMQIMAAPMALLGASVGQVYASRAQEKLRSGTLDRFTMSMMRRLFLIGLGPMLLAVLLAPSIFPLLFGPDWGRAGMIIVWIAPWMLLQLSVSPVSIAMHVSGYHGLAMALHLFGLALRVAGVGFSASTATLGPVEGFAVSSAIFYAIFAIVIFGVVRTK